MGGKHKIGFVRFRRQLDSQTGLGYDLHDDDDEPRWAYIDPGSPFLHRWNRFFLFSCLVSIFVDPLFFFLPLVDYERSCIVISRNLLISVTILRTITDFFYAVHILLQFRTAFTRGMNDRVLVTNPRYIAARYLKPTLWMDSVAVLPMPQVLIWLVVPLLSGPTNVNIKNALRFFSVILWRAKDVSRFHPGGYQVVGASWYFLSVERQATCWNDMCRIASGSKCDGGALDCSAGFDAPWFSNFTTMSNVFCNNGGNDPNADRFKYGIFQKAIVQAISSSEMLFSRTYFYCLWLGLVSLSSLTQMLEVSTYFGEVIFTIFILIVGLLLFAFLIGNMEIYLQSLTVRHQELLVTRRRIREKWMRFATYLMT